MGLFDRFFPKSHSTVLHIAAKSGLHLRPAAAFAAEAKKFDCEITAESRGKSVNAKALNALLSLNLEEGDHFELLCRGSDAAEAIAYLVNYFDTLMHQEERKKPAPPETPRATHRYAQKCIAVTPIAEGIAVAPLYKLEITCTISDNRPFREALAESKSALLQRIHEKGDSDDIAILLAQHALLERLKEMCKERGIETIEAFEALVTEETAGLEGGIHASKQSDYLDMLTSVKAAMGEARSLRLPEHPFLLLADDLLPSDIERLAGTACRGVLLHETSPLSHTAILLRNAAIPSAVIARSEKLTESIGSEKEGILDTTVGCYIPNPDPSDIALAKTRQQQHHSQRERAEALRHESARTQSGKKIRILANVASLEDARSAKASGAEGIGLLRTEFLFTRSRPSLAAQQKYYREIFALFDEVTVRTLDVGGDKALPYLDIPHESNPFLGIRGVRLFRTHPQIMTEQLHAIFLATQACPEKQIKVMFPMVSTIEEFKEAKSFAEEIAAKHHIDISHILFGMMVEVPSVLFQIEAFDTVVDFYSIGTNDLVQYLFAVERTHPLLSIDPHSPALFAALKHLMAHATKSVSLCGELAADPDAVERLIALGITTLSMSPASIPQIKETIRHV